MYVKEYMNTDVITVNSNTLIHNFLRKDLVGRSSN